MENKKSDIIILDSELTNEMGYVKDSTTVSVKVDKSLNTKDKVFLYSKKEDLDFFKKKEEYSGVHPTDYAIMSGGRYYLWSSKNNDESTTLAWLRSPTTFNPNEVYFINGGSQEVNDTSFVCRPVLRVDIKSFIDKGFTLTKGKGVYPYKVDIGLQFPRSYVGKSLSDELNSAPYCFLTGAEYIGIDPLSGEINRNPEFVYKGKRYVKTRCASIYEGLRCYSDGTICSPQIHYEWAKVEPILFRIKNYNSLPKSINPKGTGKAEYVELEAEEGLFTMPFHMSSETYSDMWQNSMIRAYLNGYNIHSELQKGNGKIDFKTNANYDFANYGFLTEALQYKNGLDNVMNISRKKDNKNPFGFDYSDLSNDEILKEYIKARVPVFLHGVSGVGKSSRVKEIDPDATRITLRPGMNAEEVDGTLDRETGKYIPPLWYQQICEKCKKEPDKMHVLFIDEITNVKPTVQSLIYSIVLERAGKDGLWPLPENCVVIGAGNETAGNLSAYPLTNALFRRFCHIYYEVDKNEWLKWATGVEKVGRQDYLEENVVDENENKNRARIHPAIVAFISSRKDDVLYQELDEEDPKIVTDPRKWEIASKVLYSTKNPNSLVPAIGQGITSSFVKFISTASITVQDILSHKLDEQNIKRFSPSLTLASIAGLTTATESQLPAVRNFILENFGNNRLATFDAMWIRNDPERALIIQSLGTQPIAKENEEDNTLVPKE